LQNYGFKVVISPRFADIFRGNSLKGGLLTVQLPQDVVEKLWAASETDPSVTVTVDLQTRTVSCGDLEVPFDIDDYTRWRLLEGLDDISLTLRHEGDIASFESNRPSHLPKTLPIPATSTS
jgi:3-isopropylmalate/(R)-2-methylmalate dehydratase small subunit